MYGSASWENPGEEIKDTGTALSARQSCKVVDVGGGALELLVDVGDVTLLHVPNAVWQPVPQ